MSFFIRKGGRGGGGGRSDIGGGGGTKFGGGGGRGGGKKPGNTEMKRRPQKRDKTPKHLLKRKQQADAASRKFDISKKPRIDPNEEIESSSDGEDDDEGRKKVNHEPRIYATKEDLETPQEKKLRLAKLYLDEIEREESERKENEEVDSHLLVSNRLREDLLEEEGRLRKEIAEKIEPDLQNFTVLSCAKYLKRAVTSVCISPDNQWIFSGCKDGNLIKWSVNEKKKVGMVKRKEKLSTRKKKKGIVPKPDAVDPNSVHSTTITALAISSDGKFLASGDLEKQVVIWDPSTLKRIHIFSGHRGPIRGLVFRKTTHTLYSCSDDRSLRIWSLDEMGYVETLFGHQDSVTCVDALTRERAISSGGRDNSIRVWKIVEESQLVYNGHYNGSIDSVKLVNEENFISCGDDGNLCTWNVNRKKPLVTERNAHGVDATTGNPNWISSIAAWNNTDLVASGSCDGLIHLWKCGERFKSLAPVTQLPCAGWINTLDFSHGSELESKFLVAGVGKEHRLGRWFDIFKNAKNSIVIIPLHHSINSLTVNTNGISASSSGSSESDNDDIDDNNEEENEEEIENVDLASSSDEN